MEVYAPLIGITIQTAIFLLGGYAMVIRTNGSTEDLKAKVDEMKDELKKLADVITMQAVQTTRLDNLTAQVTQQGKTIEDLRRGTGFIADRHAKSVEREY